MHRRAIPCNICGKMFFPASLPMHQKTCAQKAQYVTLPCSYCDQEYLRSELPAHMSKCPQKPAAARGKGVGNKSSQFSRNGQRSLDSKINSQGNYGNISDDVPTLSGDGMLVPCSVCGRKFSSDRIGKHQKICRKVGPIEAVHKNSKPVPPKPPQYSKTKNTNNKWKQQSEDLRNAIRAARGVGGGGFGGGSGGGYGLPTRPAPPDPSLVYCKYCQRRFNADTAEKHIPRCRDTINRPKPPPSQLSNRATNYLSKPVISTRSNGMTSKSRPPPPKPKQSYPDRFSYGRETNTSGFGGIKMSNETSADNPLCTNSYMAMNHGSLSGKPGRNNFY